MGAGYSRQLLDATSKTGVVEMLNSSQSWIVDANRNNGIGSAMVRRFNRGTIRWPNPWPFDSISFEVQSTANANSDMRCPVFQNGVQIGVVTATTAQARAGVTFPVTRNGGLIEVWEAWDTKDGAQNQNADGSKASTYVTAAQMPPGYAIQAATCTDAVVVVGESIVGAVVPGAAGFGLNEVFGVSGQLRLLAQAQGKLLVSLDYGGATLMGDGMTAAQFGAWIIQGIQSVGATRAVVHFNIGRNDWVNNGSSLSTTPTQGAAFMQAVMQTVTATYGKNVRFVVATQIPQGVETAVNGFTLPNWRTAWLTLTPPPASGGLTLVDSVATMNIITGVDLAVDLVHLGPTGVTKYTNVIRVPIGV